MVWCRRPCTSVVNTVPLHIRSRCQVVVGGAWKEGWLWLQDLNENSPVTLEHFLALQTVILCSGITCLLKMQDKFV